MAITDLTNTKWILNENLISGLSLNVFGYRIGFMCGGKYFYLLSWEDVNADYDNIDTYELRYYGNSYPIVYCNNGNNWIWNDQVYRTIEIIDGADVSNPDLISWLETNATQVVEPEYTLRIDGVEVTDYENVIVNGVSYKCKQAYGNITISVSSFSTLTFNHTKSDGTIVETKTASSGTVTFDNIASDSYISITGTMNQLLFDEVNCTYTHNNNVITITNIGENATITFLNSD